jgi:CRISPR-associated protein Csx17
VTTPTTITLAGCRPIPLGSYLKALGVLRLLADQVDPDATGRWAGNEFVIRSHLDRDGLLRFFLHEYRPTPVLSPWNKDAGFLPGGRDSAVAVIERSSEPRLGPYRRAIAVARRIVAEEAAHGDPSRDPVKSRLIERCRGELPDEAVAFLDAVVALTGSRAVTSPLFGTGGNDGRLEFSATFAGHIATVFGLSPGKRRTPPSADARLRAALFGEGQPQLTDDKVGQFDPGAAGGANSGPQGDAGALVNPWDYVLLVEGAVLLGGGVARKLGAAQEGRAALPFMVDAVPVGYASAASSEGSRGELWLPLWSRPATRGEIGRLLAEGRAEWNGRQARTGLDFVRAATTLAVDRGIEGFERIAFSDRHGRQMLAVSVGRVEVRDRPESRVTAGLDGWLAALRGTRDLPSAVASRLRMVEAAIFQSARDGGPAALQAVLGELAALEWAVARSGRLRNQRLRAPFVERLPAQTWVPLLDDGTPEFRLAAAIASQFDPPPAGTELRRWRMAHYLRPLAPARPRDVWAEVVSVPGLGLRPLPAVLGELLLARSIETPPIRPTGGLGHEEYPPASADPGQVGVEIAFARGGQASLSDVTLLLEGRCDLQRTEWLLSGLLFLDWTGGAVAPSGREYATRAVAPPPAFAVVSPFFQASSRVVGFRRPLRPGARWPSLLVAGRVEEVLEEALRRVQIAGRTPLVADAAAMARTVSPDLLTVALLVPLDRPAVRNLVDRMSAPSPTGDASDLVVELEERSEP